MRPTVAGAIIVVFLTVLPLLSPVHASSSQAYTDYLFQFDTYRNKLSDFKVARTEYHKYKTLTSQTTALEAAKSMMTQRDQLLKAYLLFLNEKLLEDKGLEEADKQTYKKQIANEITFLNNHSGLIPSVGSLTSANDVSKQLESHYMILQASMRQTLIALSVGSLQEQNNLLSHAVSTMAYMYQDTRSIYSAQKQGTIERWFIQVRNKQDLHRQNIDKITNNLSLLKGNSTDELNTEYNDLLKYVRESRQYLQDASSYLLELITLMKSRT